MNLYLYQPKIGDRVQYNHAFLKNIGAGFGIASMQGTIKAIVGNISKDKHMVTVAWQFGPTNTVLTSNLCRVGIDPTI